MVTKPIALVGGMLAILASAVPAQQDDPAAPPPIPPIDAKPATSDEDVPIPPKVSSGEVDPTVDIRRDEEGRVIEEYSVQGRVYMVKVTPTSGIPYYYLDEDGDGVLELRESDRAGHPVRPVYWKIKQWK